MAGMSFRTRLQLAFILVIAAALLIPALYSRYVFRGDVLEDAKTGAVRELRLAEQLLIIHGNFPSEESLHHWLEDLGVRLDSRITYLTRDGRVVADSHVGYSVVPTLDNHAFRPEIVQSESQRYGLSVRYSGTLERKLVYAAKRVSGIEGLPDGILRLAVPFADVRERLDKIYDNVVYTFAAAIFLAFVLSWVMSRSMGRSIKEMIDVAQAIGNGEYEKRLRFYPGREFEPLADTINQMASSIEQHVSVITEKKRESDAILNGMREGVLVLDADGRISKYNPALAGIFPSSQEIIGLRPLEIVLSPELQQACDKVLAPDGDNRAKLQIEPVKDRVYEVAIERLDNNSVGLGAIVVFHDISELKRLERVRRDFVANVSHELRTPLTTIKGYSETLLDNHMARGERAEAFLEIILKNADHMAKMVHDLMSLSRLEGRQERFHMQRINARGAMMEAIRTCQPLADAADVAVHHDLPESGVPVHADFDRVVQVFRNLLENAIRYSPAGTQVTISSREDGDNVVFSVGDHGPGIPQEDRERIFERFYRVEKHRTKNGSGSTGLGLAICKHIVEAHKGRIWVEAHDDGSSGVVFHFTLSAARSDEAGTEPTTNEQEA